MVFMIVVVAKYVVGTGMITVDSLLVLVAIVVRKGTRSSPAVSNRGGFTLMITSKPC